MQNTVFLFGGWGGGDLPQRRRMGSSWSPRMFLLSFLWPFCERRSWFAVGARRLPLPPSCTAVYLFFPPSSLPFPGQLPPRKDGNVEARASHHVPGRGSGGPAPRQPRRELIPSPPAGPLRYALTLLFHLVWRHPPCSGRVRCRSQRSNMLILTWSLTTAGVRAGP